MKAKKTLTRAQAFVLTPVELGRMYGLFPDNSTIVLTITCKDSIERRYESLDEFLIFEHTPDKQIKELSIHSLSEGYRDSTLISLQNSESPAANIIMICEGDEGYVASATTKLEDRFLSMKPWYALL